MLTAIMAMVLVAYIVRNVVVVETILVPPNLSVSNSTERGWFINPFGGRLTLLEGLVAVVPAFLVRRSPEPRALWLMDRLATSLLITPSQCAMDPFSVGAKLSTNWSNTRKHACYCAFMYTHYMETRFSVNVYMKAQ